MRLKETIDLDCLNKFLVNITLLRDGSYRVLSVEDPEERRGTVVDSLETDGEL